jgi:choline dehydrogenase-like flavoprotein
MVVAASTDGEEIFTDLCIVGAGPAGITIARELDGSGLRVCLLEAGDWELRRRFQRQGAGESAGYPIHRLSSSRIRAFGGTLRHPRIADEGWAARPLDPIDFEKRAHVPLSGWPFGRAHLDDHYARAAGVCGIRPYDDAAVTWSQQAVGNRLSLDGDPVEPAIFQRCIPALSDAWDALSASLNVNLLLETRAIEVEVDDTGRRVESVIAVRGRRERVVIRPRLVVLATGGIENARLLLAAQGGRGLGNEHDVVGRYFADRMTFHAGHVVLNDGVSVEDLDCFHHTDGSDVSGALRVKDEVQRAQLLQNFVFYLVPRPAAVTSEAVRSMTTLQKAFDRRPLIGDMGVHVRTILAGTRDLADLARSRGGSGPRVLALRVQGEQAPNRDSRVTLGTTSDDLGKPVPRVSWQLSEQDHRSAEASGRVVDATLREKGIGHVEWTARLDSTTLVEGSHHHLGTTRMSADPRQGAVDPQCRVHSVDNLYVAGSSVFPTYGASNPTLTIVALALRLADTLRTRLQQRSELGVDVDGLRE